MNSFLLEIIINKMRFSFILLFINHLLMSVPYTGNALETSEVLSFAAFFHCFK
jgi:hypothetical protein